jgi:hypothetical protein
VISAACGALLGCDSTGPSPAAVYIAPATVALEDGATAKLTATLRNPKTRQVRWSSSNPLVATVDVTGLVTALINGRVTITAAMVEDSSRTATADVVVSGPPVATIDVTPTSSVVYVGRTVRLSATARSGAGRVIRGRAIEWSSPQPGVAEISSTGLVTARAPGGPVSIAATVEGTVGLARIRVAHAAELCPNVIRVTLGQPYTGSLGAGDCEYSRDGSYVDVYELVLPAAATVQIDLTSSEFDPYVGLFERRGRFLAEDDDSGGNTQSRLTISLAAGSYEIWVNTKIPGMVGGYSLIVR